MCTLPHVPPESAGALGEAARVRLHGEVKAVEGKPGGAGENLLPGPHIPSQKDSAIDLACKGSNDLRPACDERGPGP